MRVMEDLFEVGWEGPLSGVADLPAALLYGAVLTFTVAGGPGFLDAMRHALEPLFGMAAERRSLLGGRRIEWTGRVAVQASVRGGQATLRFGSRVKGKRLEEAVAALAPLAGARDLRLRAAVRRFEHGKDGVPLDG